MSKTKKAELPSFETIEQLMADTYLIGRVQEKIDFINAERLRVSQGGTRKLKSSTVELLIQANKFNAEFIISEFVNVHYKRSKLYFAVREFITLTVQECVGETFRHYESIFQKQQRKTAKTKKS